MTVEFKNRVLEVLPTYTNMIRIEAEFMHGDANGYTKSVSMCHDDEKKYYTFDLQGLAFIRKLNFGVYQMRIDTLRELVIQFFETNSYFGVDNEDECDVLEQFMENFVLQDDHDDSYEYAATLEKVEVFIYDDIGGKWKVQPFVNGKELS